jgi:hypothetical protein
MSSAQQLPTPVFSSPVTDEEFYAVIDRLKLQGSLAKESFVKEIPFFTFNNITKEAQIKELFQDSSDPQMYKNLLKNIVSTPEDHEASGLISKRLSVMQVMSFAQVVLYKVLQCPDPECPNKPREIATHNQYKDYEYQCPFFHHDRDRRRLVISPNIGEEFVYKANYFEEGKRSSDKDKYSQNYFESIFHPLYYKMFRCKREYCNFSQLCPFYHSEDEKKTWDRTFSNYIRKDRISYVKDKQKYYEREENKKNKAQSMPCLDEKLSASKSDKNRANGTAKKPSGTKTQQPRIEEKEQLKPFQSKKWDDWKKETGSISIPSSKSTSKESKDSFDMKKVAASMSQIH